MNERVMQFRLGMFVIVAGLVLTMLVVWFGESPQILRERGFLKVHYAEAPGVLQGVAVRKSGIRVGEVVGIDFDDRPNQPDGVLVTIALESRFKLRKGSIPRLTRSLIGDVTVDLLPGEGEGLLETSTTPATAPIIEGEVAADPSKALAAATKVFESAGDTLKTIQEAAAGLSKLSSSAGKLDEFLATWNTTGKDLSSASTGIRTFVDENQTAVKEALANIQKASDRLNSTLDPATQDALKTGIAKFSSAAGRLDVALADAAPLMKDLGAPVDKTPATDLGQTVRRVNRIASDVELLSNTLRNGRGGLNTSGSIQRLLTQSELYDNFNAMAVSANQALVQLRVALASFRDFAEKVSRDPGAISRGALSGGR
ncbi:MlaD family protein [Paludisphaera mucosa]|uniref:MCE family protein n=1 Tax=Paludisphaera mucosa TaxID=3030827 RepID=A0ABT6F9C5_9BACT|nr:MlaD family protein [Paludisphaera mucosa]MDG3004186.1 MCE family protein [Paludisphaera mucosa]